MNSLMMHQIDSKNRVMANTWNCQKRYVSVDPKIVSKNKVPAELEIVNEYKVTANVWNRQCQ
jgi:hypothetical protein